MIICLNDIEKVNPILRDRLHIINIPGYSNKDKKIIINSYILPKLSEQYKIEVKIEESVIDKIILINEHNKGIRQLIMYLTKIHELIILDNYTNKYNFNNTFSYKDISYLKLDIDNLPHLSFYN
jgi:ATP-dependent Lon protease